MDNQLVLVSNPKSTASCYLAAYTSLVIARKPGWVMVNRPLGFTPRSTERVLGQGDRLPGHLKINRPVSKPRGHGICGSALRLADVYVLSRTVATLVLSLRSGEESLYVPTRQLSHTWRIRITANGA